MELDIYECGNQTPCSVINEGNIWGNVANYLKGKSHEKRINLKMLLLTFNPSSAIDVVVRSNGDFCVNVIVPFTLSQLKCAVADSVAISIKSAHDSTTPPADRNATDFAKLGAEEMYSAIRPD